MPSPGTHAVTVIPPRPCRVTPIMGRLVGMLFCSPHNIGSRRRLALSLIICMTGQQLNRTLPAHLAGGTRISMSFEERQPSAQEQASGTASSGTEGRNRLRGKSLEDYLHELNEVPAHACRSCCSMTPVDGLPAW